MKIYFNRSPINGPWGGGSSFVKNMSKYFLDNDHEVIYELQKDIDLIFMIDPRPGQAGNSINEIIDYKNYFPSTKVCHRINECDKRKNTNFMDRLLLESNLAVSDMTVFISKWLKSYFVERGFSKDSISIYNGCNNDYFFAKKHDIHVRPKLVTHHWSDNWMKGFDLYTKIDEHLNEQNDFDFTYIGRYYKEYQPKNTHVIQPLHGMELGDELRRHDIYVTASRFEPCGMHHIEGSSCGLPVLYHEDGGGINELCCEHGESFKDFDEFILMFNKMKENYEEYTNKINYNYLLAERCCKQYYDFIIRKMSNEH